MGRPALGRVRPRGTGGPRRRALLRSSRRAVASPVRAGRMTTLRRLALEKDFAMVKLPALVLLALLHTPAHCQGRLAPIAPLDIGKSTPRLLTAVIYECERRALRRQLGVDDTYRC